MDGTDINTSGLIKRITELCVKPIDEVREYSVLSLHSVLLS